MKKGYCKGSILALLVMVFVSMTALTVMADIVEDHPEEAAQSITITWYDTNGSAEYRIKAGTNDVTGWNDAAKVGSGASASYTVTKNGNYTIYAKNGVDVSCAVVTITNVDKEPPELSVIGMEENADGSYNVSYVANDYFSECEVRIIKGVATKGDFAKGNSVSGGMIPNLSKGTYTLLAKDAAGNISLIKMALSGSSTTESSASRHEEESSTAWSFEYHSNTLGYVPETTTVPPTTEPSTTRPPETIPPETTPPETTPPETNPPETTPPGTVPPTTPPTTPPSTTPTTTVPTTTQPGTTVPSTNETVTIVPIIETSSSEAPVTTLPQTGGLDAGMIFFILGAFAAVFGIAGLLISKQERVNGKK